MGKNTVPAITATAGAAAGVGYALYNPTRKTVEQIQNLTPTPREIVEKLNNSINFDKFMETVQKSAAKEEIPISEALLDKLTNFNNSVKDAFSFERIVELKEKAGEKIENLLEDTKKIHGELKNSLKSITKGEFNELFEKGLINKEVFVDGMKAGYQRFLGLAKIMGKALAIPVLIGSAIGLLAGKGLKALFSK